MRVLEHSGRGLRRFSWRRLVAACCQTTTLLGCASIIVGHLSLAAYFDQEKERVLEDARTVARNLNAAFEQHVVRSIKSVDQLLLVARREFERDPKGFSPAAFSRSDFFPHDMALQLAVIGPDGMMLGSSLPVSGPVDLSDREHFRSHVGNDKDDLFISRPVLGRVSKVWSIQLTRKLRDPQGGFAGVLVASLNPYYLSKIYESIDIGDSGAVTLLGLDGIIRARGGAGADALGRSISASNIFAMARDADAAVYEGSSVLDGVPRIVSYRRVPNYPLLVTVSLGRDEAMEAFEASKASILRLMLLADAALVLIMALGILESCRLRCARERLSARSHMLASTFANIKEGILVVDHAGMIVAINDLALEILGLDNRRFALPSPYAQLPLARREKMIDAKEAQQIALAGDKTIEVKTSALPDGGFLKTLSDISARKHNESALEDARDKAEAAARARTSFLATMSHEIRTPLGGILSMVDLIACSKLDLVQKRYVEMTRDSATHLLQLIDDVLDVTKLDADQVTFEDIPFDLYRQIRSTLDIVSPRAIEKKLEIGCVVAPDTPREIMGDPGRLRQVLINLLGNAIKFTQTGHVLLDVSCRSGPGGDRLCVRVADTGIGIAPESLKDLFIDFSQIDSSISRRFGGTGLGLAISRKLITRMGGSISVESEPDLGSVFFFDIPLRAVRPAEPVVDEPAFLALVAPNTFERTQLRRQLARSFARFEAFDTLAKARESLLAAGPQMRRILLIESALAPDGGVRSMAGDGLDVVLLCARNDMFAADEALSQGYFGFVHKPLFPDELRDCLMHGSARAESPASTEQRPSSEGRLAGQRVLIAEDNATSQFALCRMLETMGAQVTAADNGREAADLAARQTFDVILMDVMMPVLDGLAAAQDIRSRPGPNAAAPIIALTASAFIEDREAALSAGMNAFATKPITAQSLLETIIACQARVAAVAQAGESAFLVIDEAGGRDLDMQQDAEADPVIDHKLLEQLRQDLGPEHMNAALGLFYKDMEKRISALRSGDRSAAHLRKEAHALKGSAASFGFRRVASAAARLEDAARQNESDKLDALLEALLNEAAAAPDLLAA